MTVGTEGRDGIEVTGQEESTRPSEGGTGQQGVAVTVDGQMGGLPEPPLEVVGQR
jgi:hypothetical protein